MPSTQSAQPGFPDEPSSFHQSLAHADRLLRSHHDASPTNLTTGQVHGGAPRPKPRLPWICPHLLCRRDTGWQFDMTPVQKNHPPAAPLELRVEVPELENHVLTCSTLALVRGAWRSNVVIRCEEYEDYVDSLSDILEFLDYCAPMGGQFAQNARRRPSEVPLYEGQQGKKRWIVLSMDHERPWLALTIPLASTVLDRVNEVGCGPPEQPGLRQESRPVIRTPAANFFIGEL